MQYRFTLLALALFLTAGPVVSQVNPKVSADLLEHAQEHGWVSVIVELDIPFEVESALRSDALVNEQRSQIHTAQQEVLAVLFSRSASRIITYSTIPYLAVTVDEAALHVIADYPGVRAIHEDRLMWKSLEESTALIGAPDVWTAGYTGAGQVVAVLDTGTDLDHPFLADRTVAEGCFSTPIDDPIFGGGEPLCPNGQTTQTGAGSSVSTNCEGLCDHGTHVAGIALGQIPTLSGVAPEADLIGVQVFHKVTNFILCLLSGSLPPCITAATSDVLAGLEYVYEIRDDFSIAAVNMSLGGGEESDYCDTQPIKAIIDNLRGAGIATVIASGNNGFTSAISYPSCVSTSISVGSTHDGSEGTIVDAVSSFSNSAAILDLLAPGQWITSSVIGGGYETYAGTSMAAPHVAGAWAVLRQANPNATVDEILNAVASTGISVLDPRNGLTRPRLQLDEAVALIADDTPSSPPIAAISETVFEFEIGPDKPLAQDQFQLSNLAAPGSDNLEFGIHYAILTRQQFVGSWGSMVPTEVDLREFWLLEIDPSEGSIEAGDSWTITLSADYDEWEPLDGIYEFVITIDTNDPGNPALHAYLNITVGEVEDYCQFNITHIEFEETWIGYPQMLSTTVTNVGGVECEITEADSNNYVFTVGDPEQSILQPGNTTTIPVSFSPDFPGNHVGLLTVTASGWGVMANMNGAAVSAPKAAIDLETDIIEFVVESAEDMHQTFEIMLSNLAPGGNAQLTFENVLSTIAHPPYEQLLFHLGVEPETGEVEAGSQQSLVLSLNAEGLSNAVRWAELTISTNDPEQSFWAINVSVDVRLVSTQDHSVPVEFGIQAVHPNPFTDRSIIRLGLPETSDVTVEVFDITGRRVAVLADGIHPAGVYEIPWNAVGLASGTYVIRANNGRRNDSRQITVVR